MSRTLYKLPQLACAAALCTKAFLFANANSQQGVPQIPVSSASNDPVYFPPGTVEGFAGFFSEYLSRFGEPSLFAAAQNPSVHSYRLDWLSSQHGYVLVVRILLNPDGGAEVIAMEESGKPDALQRTQNRLSGADVKKFLQLVEKADFWTMPAENPDPRRKAYKFDASPWVFEGVRNGSYHVVRRLSPNSSPFTEMVRFLAKDLAKLDDSAIPHAYPSTPSTDPGAVKSPSQVRE